MRIPSFNPTLAQLPTGGTEALLPRSGTGHRPPSTLGQALRFTEDKDSGELVIWVLNRDTGAVLRRIPMAEAEGFRAASDYATGQLVSRWL